MVKVIRRVGGKGEGVEGGGIENAQLRRYIWRRNSPRVETLGMLESD